MRVIPHAPFGIRNADRLEQLDGTVACFALDTSRWAQIIAAIWSPTRYTGLSDVIGS